MHEDEDEEDIIARPVTTTSIRLPSKLSISKPQPPPKRSRSQGFIFSEAVPPYRCFFRDSGKPVSYYSDRNLYTEKLYRYVHDFFLGGVALDTCESSVSCGVSL